jgi:hypothetical protein
MWLPRVTGRLRKPYIFLGEASASAKELQPPRSERKLAGAARVRKPSRNGAFTRVSSAFDTKYRVER